MINTYEAFISYRHSENNELAKALHDELEGAYSIDSFRDDECLHFGDFRRQLVLNNIKSRFLVLLLTPTTLERCHQPNDWITKEISLFLRLGKPIIPVKMNGFEYPQNLPDKIKDLIKHDGRSITVTVNDPVSAAKTIAAGVKERLRKGWSPRAVEDAVTYKQYLHGENTDVGSYFYKCANELRRYFFLALMQIGLSILFFNLIFDKTPAGLVFGNEYELWSILSGLISAYMLLFEFKKVQGASFVEILLDRSIWRAIGYIYKSLLIFTVPFVIAVMVLPFGVVLLDSLIGEYVFHTTTVTQVGAEAWYACIFTVVGVLPCFRIAVKLLFSIVHFVNSVIVIYPVKYRVWRITEKTEKIVKIVGWCLLLPAMLGAGWIAINITGGFA